METLRQKAVAVLQAGEAIWYSRFPALCFYLEPHLLGQFILTVNKAHKTSLITFFVSD